MESQLIRKFYEGIWVNVLVCFSILFVIILLTIFRKKIIYYYENIALSKIIVYSLILVLLIVEVVFIIKFIPYCKDLKVVKQKDFETITGTVVEYTYIREGNDPNDPIQLKPIVKDINSDMKIQLNVTGTNLYHTYKFIYLPNTRIAVIVPADDI